MSNFQNYVRREDWRCHQFIERVLSSSTVEDECVSVTRADTELAFFPTYYCTARLPTYSTFLPSQHIIHTHTRVINIDFIDHTVDHDGSWSTSRIEKRGLRMPDDDAASVWKGSFEFDENESVTRRADTELFSPTITTTVRHGTSIIRTARSCRHHIKALATL